jgi:hypothetical protein
MEHGCYGPKAQIFWIMMRLMLLWYIGKLILEMQAAFVNSQAYGVFYSITKINYLLIILPQNTKALTFRFPQQNISWNTFCKTFYNLQKLHTTRSSTAFQSV